MTENWFDAWFEQFWLRYDAKHCGGGTKKGPKGKAKESAKKQIKDEKMGEKIMQALEAQIRYKLDAESNGTWVPNMPMAVTWINQQRWDIEIDSHADLREKRAAEICDCGQEAVVIGKCAYCYSTFANPVSFQQLREAYVRHGLARRKDETPADHRKRLIQTCKTLIKGIGK